jgi:hypothetical protein
MHNPRSGLEERALRGAGRGSLLRGEPTALKNPELWLVVSGFWLMVTGWMQVDSGIVMASGSP